MSEKNKVGRPTKYRKEYCQKLIDHMGQGYPYETFAGTIDCSREVLYDWEKRYPEFLHAKKQAIDKCYLALVDFGRQGMFDPKNFSPAVWAMMMKNIILWRDNPEPDQANETKEITINYNLG